MRPLALGCGVIAEAYFDDNVPRGFCVALRKHPSSVFETSCEELNWQGSCYEQMSHVVASKSRGSAGTKFAACLLDQA